MKKLNLILLTIVLIAVSFVSYSQDGASTITVTKMGTLETILNRKQKNTITTMVLKGEINKADFDVMKSQMPNLTYLDLKDVKCEGDKIPSDAFGDIKSALSNKNIATIILPLSIKIIEFGAFRYCKNLTNLSDFPDGLTTIGAQAFRRSGLKGPVNLPNGLTSIGSRAFLGCGGLTGTLTLPDGLTIIKDQLFYKCTFLTGLEVGNNVTTIGKQAFQDCVRISENIIFPEGIASIGEGAFDGCDKVYSFRFPSTTPIQHEAKMLPAGATLHIPASGIATYKATDGWKGYNLVGY